MELGVKQVELDQRAERQDNKVTVYDLNRNLCALAAENNHTWTEGRQQ